MNKKFLIVIVIAIVIILGVIGAVCYKNVKNNVDSEVVEIVNKLNNGTGDCGDWSKGLYITKVNKVKKVDVNLLNDNEKTGMDKNSKIFIMNLEERTYGEVEIAVVNGEVTANSILGETIDELWGRNIFTEDKINIEKVNKEIK